MIRYYIGAVGSGKTTMAIYNILKDKKNKKYLHVYANFDNTACSTFHTDGLKKHRPPCHSSLHIDESGIEFNSRAYKSFDKGFIEYFKLHRHNYDDICIYSQSLSDTDKILRDLCSEIWLLKKFFCFTFARRVFIKIGIDKETKQLIEQYSMTPLLLSFFTKDIRCIFRPLYYRYFNSHSPIDRDEWQY